MVLCKQRSLGCQPNLPFAYDCNPASRVEARNFPLESKGVNPHSKRSQTSIQKDACSNRFSTKESWDSDPALESILRILRINICLYQASTDCHPEYWLRSWTCLWIPNQSGVRQRLQKCTLEVLDERSRCPMMTLILSDSWHHSC